MKCRSILISLVVGLLACNVFASGISPVLGNQRARVVAELQANMNIIAAGNYNSTNYNLTVLNSLIVGTNSIMGGWLQVNGITSTAAIVVNGTNITTEIYHIELATNALTLRATSLETSTNAMNTIQLDLVAATNALNVATNGLQVQVTSLNASTNAMNTIQLALVAATNALTLRATSLETSTNAMNTIQGYLVGATNGLNIRANSLEGYFVNAQSLSFTTVVDGVTSVYVVVSGVITNTL